MTKPTTTTQELQKRIGHRAKSAPEHRFWGLYVETIMQWRWISIAPCAIGDRRNCRAFSPMLQESPRSW
jgi:hypothetical protein